MASSQKRIRKDRKLEEKLEIIKYPENNTSMKKKDTADSFEMSPQTLGNTLKSVKNICSTCSVESRGVEIPLLQSPPPGFPTEHTVSDCGLPMS